MEHIFSVTSIIEHARSNGMPVNISFLDLRNAFGSISHSLIADILSHLLVPSSVRSYITNAYSKLLAFVSSKNWSTPPFSITRGVFQGDTLSPIIFLLAFNPIIQLANSLQCPGFVFRIPLTGSDDLPPSDSSIYVEWNELSSNEDPGWYKCRVSSYDSSGNALLLYHDQLTEIVDLNTTSWRYAKRSAKKFLPSSSPPPMYRPSGISVCRTKRMSLMFIR